MGNNKTRSLIIHGHFYQPPRENPWTNLVELQPSAAPAHDWNERINQECYVRNGCAPVMDAGMVTALLNNYEYISFNFGPTLLSWLSEHAPETLAAIIEGDRLSALRCNGHGNAIAQVFNHMIMPLASARDKKTQVLWGIADFKFRFGREPEGMHLAECAVDTATLETLAEAGIKFTLLAPRQAKSWRKIGSNDWSTSGGIDPSRAYLCKLPSGKSITIFFYDGPISRAVAFEKLLNSGPEFLKRLKLGYSKDRQHYQLMHIATDGESYGHHHPYGEMCLSWVLNQLSSDNDIQLTNYGQFLAEHPAEYEVQIHESSSWSCDHGIERWRSHCGCEAGRNTKYHQRWRGPLRDALNYLSGRLNDLFEKEGARYFKDAWAARDAYIAVLLNTACTCEFLSEHGKSDLSHIDRELALALLEMQRFAMYSFTSCGWFFDEISEIEPVHNLLDAARAIEMARQFTDEDLESMLLYKLDAAPSNLPDFGTGRGVWDKLIRPLAVVAEIQLLYEGKLNRPTRLQRLRRLLHSARQARVPLDESLLRMRLLDAYIDQQAAGSLDDTMTKEFKQLAAALNLDVRLLGWNRDGQVPPTQWSKGRKAARVPPCLASQAADKIKR